MKTESTSSTSIDDLERVEMLWTSRQENLLKAWMTTINDLSDKCIKKGGTLKRLYHICGIPASITPIILGGLSSTILTTYPLVMSVLLIVSGCMAGVSGFMDYGRKSQQNYDYASRLVELSIEVDTILHKSKRGREPCDVILERVKQRYIALKNVEPN